MNNWEKQFDEKFGEYGTFGVKGIDALETEIAFRLNIKSFIEKLLSKQREEILGKIEAMMLDKIYYIGNELPQVKEDVRDKFVLLGFPQGFLDELKKALSDIEK